MIAAAMWYARHGYAVMPLHSAIDGVCSCGNAACGSVAKHPRTQHGLEDATKDSVVVADYWARWPDANIGIATGPSDLVVIDIDPKNGGDESFAILRGELGSAAFETVTALTGGGGEHYYFRVGEKRFRNSAGKVLGDGIDVRADGGYVVAPKSVHASGRSYAWEAGFGIHEHSIMPIPPALELKLSQRKTQITGERPDVEIIPLGRRHETLVSLAGLMRRHQMGPDEIEAALLVVNEKRCRPMCEPAHMRQIAISVSKYAPSVGLTELVRGVMPEVKPDSLVVAADAPLVPEQAGFAVLRSWQSVLDERRYSTGLPALDDVLRCLRPGEISLIGAWTGVGKSGFSEQLALEISKSARTLFLPLELGVERTERRMLAKLLRCDEETVECMERSKSDSERRALYEAVELLQSRRLTMLAPEDYRSEQLVELIRANKPDVVFIDHMQHIQDWSGTGTRSDLAAARIFRKLRSVCVAERVHIVCIHQLKAEKIKRSQRPQIYDFADSASLPRVADTVLALHRPFRGTPLRDTIMEILVLKNRRGPEPWIHTHFEGSHIAMYPMTKQEAMFAECCSPRNAERA